MRGSTKVVAWLWLSLGALSVVWRLAGHGHGQQKPAAIIAALVWISLLNVLPAVSLLRGSAAGWWAILLMSGYSAVVTPLVAVLMHQHIPTSRILSIAVCVICFVGLLIDHPARWRARERPEEAPVPTATNKLTWVVVAIAVIAIALPLLGMLVGGADYIASLFGSRVSIR